MRRSAALATVFGRPETERTRLRLTTWYAVALGALLVIAGLALLTIVEGRLLADLDDQLSEATRSVGASVEIERGRLHLEDAEGMPSDLVWAVTDASGQPLAQSSGATGRDLAAIAGSGSPAPRTVRLAGQEYRTAGLPIERRGSIAGYVHTARSLEALRETMVTLRAVLATEGLAVLALAAVAGYVLAGRAIAPILAARAREQEFLADASHELRTPLAIATTGVELMIRGEHVTASPAWHELEDVLSELRRLERLVGDVGTLARAGQGKLEIDRRPVEVPWLMEEAARSFRNIAAQAAVTLDVSAAPVAVVEGDPDRLLQVLRILLDNAVRYTPEGGRVALQGTASERQVRIVVTDSGIGIPPEQLRHVFDRFYRVDRARQRHTGGAGLGLAIAQSLVQAHGGSISATSAEGNGTVLTVILPRAA